MMNKVDGMKEQGAARLAQALSHPVRLRILELLRNQGAYVMHLTSMLGRPQANISQHLAILRDAGMVTDEREGMTVVYRVRDQRVFDLMDRLFVLAAGAAEISESERTGSRWQGGGLGMRGMGPAGHCHCPRCAGR
jgi:DNA-binding transcriptional ArsR family regulator